MLLKENYFQPIEICSNEFIYEAIKIKSFLRLIRGAMSEEMTWPMLANEAMDTK